MKQIQCFLRIIVVATITVFLSCTNAYTDLLETKSDLKEIGPETKASDLALAEEEIVPLLVNPDSIKSRLVPRNYPYNSTLSDNFWAIRGYNFTIKARGGGNTGILTLAGNGPGQELSLGGRNTIMTPKFYVKILPATSGIPYLIYSAVSNTPIAVGSYPSTPNNKVLFALNSESGSLQSASWDIKHATNNPGYLIIQSESYIGQGASGNWMDIFYHVIEIRDNNKIGFAKYQQAPSQEFIITPEVSFSLTDIKYVDEWAAKVTPGSDYIITNAYTNDKASRVNYDMLFTKTILQNSSFRENKGINFKIGNLNQDFKRPSVIQGKIDLVPSANVLADAKYVPSENISKTLSSTLAFNIPPKTKLIVNYRFKTYTVEVNYEATIKVSDRETKLKGVWRGVIHIDEVRKEEQDVQMLNLLTGKITPIKINATKSNRIIL